MELNVKNMPLEKVYRFDINKYIYTTMMESTRDGIRRLSKPLTEVFEINNEGDMHFLASGELVNSDDYSHGFIINDADKKEMIAFRVTMYLQEVSSQELDEICDAVAINQNKSK